MCESGFMRALELLEDPNELVLLVAKSLEEKIPLHKCRWFCYSKHNSEFWRNSGSWSSRSPRDVHVSRKQRILMCSVPLDPTLYMYTYSSPTHITKSICSCETRLQKIMSDTTFTSTRSRNVFGTGESCVIRANITKLFLVKLTEFRIKHTEQHRHRGMVLKWLRIKLNFELSVFGLNTTHLFL